MGMKKAALHNGKKSQKTGKVIRPYHNDTEREKNPNVKEEWVSKNVYYNCYDGIYSSDTQEGKLSFRDAELKYYTENFSDALDVQNEKHIKARQKNRIKTMTDWLDSPRYAPTESIIHVGNVDTGFASEEDISAITNDLADYLRDWSDGHNNCLHILNYAVHMDEFYTEEASGDDKASSFHSHLRYVFSYTDDNGNKAVGTEKALEQAGCDLPYPDKKIDRYNNRMMTFTAVIRSKLQEIAMSYGYEIDIVPSPTKKRSKDKSTYIAERVAEKKAAEAEKTQQEADAERLKYIELREQAEREIAELQAKKDELNDRENAIAAKEAEVDGLKQKYTELVADAENILSQAKNTAADIEKQAEQKADSIISQAQQQHDELEDENEKLKVDIADNREQLKIWCDGIIKSVKKPFDLIIFKKESYNMDKADYDALIEMKEKIERLSQNALYSDDYKETLKKEAERQKQLNFEHEQLIHREAKQLAKKMAANVVDKYQKLYEETKNLKENINRVILTNAHKIAAKANPILEKMSKEYQKQAILNAAKEAEFKPINPENIEFKDFGMGE